MKLSLSLFRLSLIALSSLFATSQISHAQVTPDGTVNTQVNQNGNVSEITGGETRGSNLFHSFREFSIGNVSIEDGGIIFAPGGRVELGGLIETGTIDITNDGNFSFPNGVARGDVSLTNSSIVAVFSGGGGSIEVNANNFELSSGSQLLGGIRAETGSPDAEAGDIVIDVVENVAIDGTGSDAFTGITNRVFENGIGSSGNIEITTSSLTLTNGGLLSANISGQGNAGNIIVNATENISFKGVNDSGDQSGISNDVSDNGIGNAGNINLKAKNLFLSDGGEINANIEGIGNAGNIDIVAENIALDGFRTQISSDAFPSAEGNSGDINVSTGELVIRDGATILAGNLPSSENSFFQESGTGQPGNINIEANSIHLENKGSIDAATQSETGEAGNISLQVANDITLRNKSFISARALSNANGGNISIDTRFLVAFPNQNNDIVATSEQGAGGNINISTRSIFGLEIRPSVPTNTTNDIDVSGDFNFGSIREIFAIEVSEVPTNLIETDQTSAQACNANRESAARNGLTIKGKGGVPPAPDLPLNSENITINGELVDSSSPNPEIKPISTKYGEIIPARGVLKTEDGRVILTAYPTDNNQRIPNGSLNCGKSSN